jgi:hypothetical protein
MSESNAELPPIGSLSLQSSSSSQPKRAGPPTPSLTDLCIERIALNFEDVFRMPTSIPLSSMPEHVVLYLAVVMFRMQRISNSRIIQMLLNSNHPVIKTMFEQLNVDMAPLPMFSIGCRPNF